MTKPAAATPPSQTSLRRDEKQGRVFERSGVVRVTSENEFLVETLRWGRDSRRIRCLLEASNSLPVWTHGGKLVSIRLKSFGDDRGHSGEGHGTSTSTTERVRNDNGILVGHDRILKHKAENVAHAIPPPAWSAEASRNRPIRAPLNKS
jgi:hypothetical protein